MKRTKRQGNKYNKDGNLFSEITDLVVVFGLQLDGRCRSLVCSSRRCVWMIVAGSRDKSSLRKLRSICTLPSCQHRLRPRRCYRRSCILRLDLSRLPATIIQPHLCPFHCLWLSLLARIKQKLICGVDSLIGSATSVIKILITIYFSRR